MDFLNNIFNAVLYQPLFNALVWLNNYLPGHDFGISVVVLTVLIRFLFYPLGTQAIRSQKILTDLQPKIQEIQKTYKNDRDKQTKAIIELYQKEKINPLSGCLPVLLQVPILIALWRVFWKGLQPEELSVLYSFIPNPGFLNPVSLGIINLAQPNLILALLAGVSQFIQTKTTPSVASKAKADGDKMSQFSDLMQKQMLSFFPFFTVVILLRLPAAIALYWIVTSLFSIGQQYFVFRKRHV